MRTFASANGLPFIHLLPPRFAADAEMRGAPEQRFHEPVAFLDFGVAAGSLARAPAALRLVFHCSPARKSRTSALKDFRRRAASTRAA